MSAGRRVSTSAGVWLPSGADPAPLKEARRAFERAYIEAVLSEHGGRVADAARALGLQRPNLYRKARQLRIDLRRADPNQP